MTSHLTLDSVEVGGHTITYREQGDGPAVLLLHGWPTSSFMWRNVMPHIAHADRAIAVDLPGFGGSDKPTDVRYDFTFFGDVLDGFLDALGVDDVAIVVHDLGGPVGLHWALNHRERITGIALLNTLVYPEFDDAVVEFVATLMAPDRRETLTSPRGLEEVLTIGFADESNLTADVVAAVRAPFADAESRLALAKAGIGLPVPGFVEIAERLPTLSDVPIRIIYGEHDRILPDVAETMARVQSDLPHAVTTVLPHGHFLLEEAPDEVGPLLADFLAAATASRRR